MEYYNSLEESDAENHSEDDTQSEAVSEGGDDDTPEPHCKPYSLRNRKPVDYRFVTVITRSLWFVIVKLNPHLI